MKKKIYWGAIGSVFILLNLGYSNCSVVSKLGGSTGGKGLRGGPGIGITNV